MSRKAYVGFGAKRMSDLAQSVCWIWRKAYVGFGAKRMSDLAQSVFGAKRFWALPQTGCRTTEVVIYGRQADKWWRCVYGIVEVCVGDGGGV